MTIKDLIKYKLITSNFTGSTSYIFIRGWYKMELYFNKTKNERFIKVSSYTYQILFLQGHNLPCWESIGEIKYL